MTLQEPFVEFPNYPARTIKAQEPSQAILPATREEQSSQVSSQQSSTGCPGETTRACNIHNSNNPPDSLAWHLSLVSIPRPCYQIISSPVAAATKESQLPAEDQGEQEKKFLPYFKWFIRRSLEK